MSRSNLNNTSAGNHIWSFSSIGGVKRVNFESGSDLIHLEELDPKLWTALSCPVNGLEIDSRTLQLIDTDKDGHIRVPEVIGAVNWMISVINNPDDLLKESDNFPLSALNAKTEQGKALLDSAKVILKNLGKDGETALTVDDTSDTVKIFTGTLFNGDGVITAASAGEDEDAIALLNEVIQCSTSVADRSGDPGINQDILSAFLDNCEKFAGWQDKMENAVAAVLPFGEDTGAAYENYKALKEKVDDYFLRCRMAAFDPTATEVLNLQIERVGAITDKNLPGCIDEIATYPIAAIAADKPLQLSHGINPAWATQMAFFKEQTAKRLLGKKETMDEAGWQKVAETFSGFENWNAEKEGDLVEQLGIVRVKEILAGAAKDKLALLIENDSAVETEANNMILVDQVVRYYRDLFTLLKNFVTFFDFYTPGAKAVFQAGTLYIDQRSSDVCIRVNDMARQDALAPYSGIYLLYCDCISKATNQRMTIVAAVTNGDVDDLIVGRNAIFFDRNGLDWDATIIKIKENPISIRQAFFAPYRRLMQFVEKQINKVAQDHDAKVTANLQKNTESAGKEIAGAGAADATKPPVAAEAFDVGKFAGIFAAIGLALGAIGSIVVAIVTGFMKLTWWKMPFAILAVLLLISGPSMIIAFLKLRRRNLAPILDANGWAINSRVKINIQFGRTLTHLAMLPKGAKVNLVDPFMKKRTPLWLVILILLAVIALAFFILCKLSIIKLHF